MKGYIYRITISKEGNMFVAQCMVPDVSSQGETEEEAISNVFNALSLYFDDEPMDKTRITDISPKQEM